MGKRIVPLGDGLWDLFADGPRFGGATANFACHASLMGGEVFMVSGVGKDERGEAALKIFRSKGVEIDLIQTLSSYPTGIVTVELDESGIPHFTIGEDSAWDHWEWNSNIEKKVRSADAVYFGTLGQRGKSPREGIRKALEIAKHTDILRVLDINLRPPFYDDALIRESISCCTVLKLSEEEFEPVCRACNLDSSEDVEKTLAMLRIQYELDVVVMTQGAEGAVLLTEAEVVRQSGIPSRVVDTVGAGDSFTASLTIGLLQDRKDLVTILLNACKVASKACSHPGAIPE